MNPLFQHVQSEMAKLQPGESKALPLEINIRKADPIEKLIAETEQRMATTHLALELLLMREVCSHYSFQLQLLGLRMEERLTDFEIEVNWRRFVNDSDVLYINNEILRS